MQLKKIDGHWRVREFSYGTWEIPTTTELGFVVAAQGFKWVLLIAFAPIWFPMWILGKIAQRWEDK